MHAASESRHPDLHAVDQIKYRRRQGDARRRGYARQHDVMCAEETVTGATETSWGRVNGLEAFSASSPVLLIELALCPGITGAGKPPGHRLTEIEFHVERQPESDRPTVFGCGPEAHLHGGANGFFVQPIRQAFEDAHLFHQPVAADQYAGAHNPLH